MGRILQKVRCGTALPDWVLKDGFRRVAPAEVYVNETGLCLITSQEWVDWLTDKVADIPSE